MDCRRIESLLPPYVDGEARRHEIAEVEHHLAACPACQSAVTAQRTVRFVLQARGREVAAAAPLGLRTRVAATMREPAWRPLGWRGRLSAFAAAAALVIIVMAGLEFVSPRSNVLYAAQLALDHVRCFVVEMMSTDEVDAAMLEREYADRYDWRLRVPPSNASLGLRLVAARRCPFWLGRHAHVLYRIGEREVSLYIDQGETRSNDQLNVLGHTETIWQSHGSSYALIARGVPDAELTQIVGYLQKQTE